MIIGKIGDPAEYHSSAISVPAAVDTECIRVPPTRLLIVASDSSKVRNAGLTSFIATPCAWRVASTRSTSRRPISMHGDNIIDRPDRRAGLAVASAAGSMIRSTGCRSARSSDQRNRNSTCSRASSCGPEYRSVPDTGRFEAQRSLPDRRPGLGQYRRTPKWSASGAEW